MAADRAGHVSRSRIFAEGSVFARRLQEQRERQAQQQQVDAAAQHEALEPAQVTWPELWDARTTAGFVGVQLGQQENSAKAMQLWWGLPDRRRKAQIQHTQKSLLHYSGVISRVLQRTGSSSRGQHQVNGQPSDSVQQQGATDHISLTVTPTAELFGPPIKRRRLQLDIKQQDSMQLAGANGNQEQTPAAWVCCNVLQGDVVGDQEGTVQCGTPNAGRSSTCCACGAARWDGPDGQAQQRINAALQTADLDDTNIRQVMARIVAESGSRPDVGHMPQGGLQPDVTAIVEARRRAQQAQEAQGLPPPSSTAHGSTAGCATLGAAGACTGDDLQLLEQYGCIPAAHGVYTSLLTWLKQQQQQQGVQSEQPGEQQEEVPAGAAGCSAQLQPAAAAAAAAAAACAPDLLAAVLKQQGGLPALQMPPGSLLSWVSTCFEEGAAAAAEASTHAAQPVASQQQQQQQQQQQRPPHSQASTALPSPLPLHTLLALCDRRGASVRQSLADIAAAAVGACGGCLPCITRTYELDGVELTSDVLRPEQWLWSCVSRDTQSSRKLRAADGADGPQEEEEGDLDVVESITSEHWEEVCYVRSRVQQLLAAWHSSLRQQVGAAPPGTPLAKQQPSVAKAWDSQMRKLLPLVVQQVSRGWGTAPTWRLRDGLRAQAQQQPQQQQEQQQQPQQPQQPQQQQPAAGSQPAPGAAAPAGAARRSSRLQAQGTRQQAEKESESSSSSEGEGPTTSSSASSIRSQSQSSSDGSSSGPSDSASSDSSGHGSDQNEAWADLTAKLLSLDDLMLPPVQPSQVDMAGAAAAAAAAEPGQRGVRGTVVTPWEPSANSMWRPVGPGQSAGAGEAAGRRQSRRAAGEPGGGGAGSSRAGHRQAAARHEGFAARNPSWACLPAGMRMVLSQAALAGVAPEVLERAQARLVGIVGDQQGHGNQS